MTRWTGLFARFVGSCQRSSSSLTESAAAASAHAIVTTTAAAPTCSTQRSAISLHSIPNNPWRQLWRSFATSTPVEPPPNYFVGLGNLRDNPAATRPHIRVGRGNSARRGNYGGRGMKGQKSRGRGLHMLYDGGQLGLLKFPVTRQRPPYEVLYYHLGIRRVMEFVQLGLLDPSRSITMKDLYDTGCITTNVKYGVLLYGTAPVQIPLDIQVTACDPETKACVEVAGGRVVRVYYTVEGLGAVLHPGKYSSRRLPLPLPAARWHPRYDGKFDAIGRIPPVVRPNLLTAVGSSS